MTAKKKILFLSFLFTLPILHYSLASKGPAILIESLESKTQEGKQVFNKIDLIESETQDEWIMHQSHYGKDLPTEKWDEIKIIVNKTKNPYEVSYHEYKNGKESEYRASCFTCHANGPRVIRANTLSKAAPLSLKERYILSYWNFKIKTYGPMKTVENNPFKRTVPLSYIGQRESAELGIKTCLHCHNGEGILSRAKLQRQHGMTIEHLVKTRAMPPWPYKMTEQEKIHLKRFIKGF